MEGVQDVGGERPQSPFPSNSRCTVPAFCRNDLGGDERDTRATVRERVKQWEWDGVDADILFGIHRIWQF